MRSITYSNEMNDKICNDFAFSEAPIWPSIKTKYFK